MTCKWKVHQVQMAQFSLVCRRYADYGFSLMHLIVAHCSCTVTMAPRGALKG